MIQEIPVELVLAQLSERGKVEWELAFLKAQNKAQADLLNSLMVDAEAEQIEKGCDDCGEAEG